MKSRLAINNTLYFNAFIFNQKDSMNTCGMKDIILYKMRIATCQLQLNIRYKNMKIK